MNTRFVWRGVFVRLESLRYLDGGVVIEAFVDGGQDGPHGRFEEGEVLRRFTACIGLGRELGNRDSLIAIKNCAENDGIVPVLIEMGLLQPDLRRTVPSILGSCLVYELTAGAQALAIDQSEWAQA